jgi:hypothetical protein
MPVCCVILTLRLQATCQTDKSQPCLASDEVIYTPGEDHVKAPTLRMERRALDPPLNPSFHAVLEVVINSAGTICEVRALKAPDRDTAQKLAEDVADNFRFSPASRRGKPVAARFKIIFNLKGQVSTQ